MVRLFFAYCHIFLYNVWLHGGQNLDLLVTFRVKETLRSRMFGLIAAVQQFQTNQQQVM